MKTLAAVCSGLVLCAAQASDWHVAVGGDDRNKGTPGAPFRTIQRAAAAAQPGDCVTVHAGVYRERVNPPRGGESDSRRIVYQAAPGEQVTITGAEVVNRWENEQGDVWKAVLPNSLFGAFNPYSDLIRGDWFNAKGRAHHTGAVYVEGDWLTEAPRLEDVMKPAGSSPLWFSRVDQGQTTIWAQFKGLNPNEKRVEINVRQTVFYPDKPGRNYITVRGFKLCQAATPWAPPTAEQVGLIGTHWSKGWLLENNVISHSICSGISLGKHGDAYDNTSANTAEGYVKTIERAYAHPIAWTKDSIGHHVVRSNRISHCEQTGIVGSLGCAFSVITGNVIHDIHVRQLFTGAEMAGIKFHGAIDVEISNNRIFRTSRGLWLDWMAQGTRVTRNLFHDNSGEDVFVEVNHGPFLFDNNLLLSGVSLMDWSEGGAYAHNLLAGKIISRPELKRETPYHAAHSTALAGLRNIRGGDNRFFNNVFFGETEAAEATARADRGAGYGLSVYNAREFPLLTGGNVYLNNARPYSNETGQVVRGAVFARPALVCVDGNVFLSVNLARVVQEARTMPVNTALLGKAEVPQLGYENPDGTFLSIDADYFGKRRSAASPKPGPFEAAGAGEVKIQVW